MASDSMVSVSGLHRAVIQGLTRQSRAPAPSLALDPRVKPEGDERRGRNTAAPPPNPVFAGLDPPTQRHRSVACPGPSSPARARRAAKTHQLEGERRRPAYVCQLACRASGTEYK